MYLQRTKLIGNPTFPYDLNFFIATISLLTLFRPLYTAPYDPSYAFSRITYFSLKPTVSIHYITIIIHHQIIIIIPTIKQPNPPSTQTIPLLIPPQPSINNYNKNKNLTTMGKIYQEDKSHTNSTQSPQLHVSSEDMKSLANFMRKLREDFKNKTSKTILPKIHTILKQNKRKIYFDFTKIKEKLRICKKCDKWNNIREMIQCSKCEDNFHQNCLKDQVQTLFVCMECRKGSKNIQKCYKCKKVSTASEVKKCKECLLPYHKRCWNNTNTICSKCCRLKKQIKKATNTKALQAYRENIATEDTVSTFRSKLFNFQKFIRSEGQLKKYASSLTNAIKDKKMLYSQQLINVDEFQGILNQNSMDFGINYMTNQECRAYEEYKKMPIGPYILRTIENKGYDVIADRDIPERTLICEYVGEVVSLRQCIELQQIRKNDSLMQLQAGKNSEETLIIRPEKFTNMARFINGVKKNSNQENIESMKLLYKDRPVVLLVAKRAIRRGESLCYDYNAGGIVAEYDTSHFV